MGVTSWYQSLGLSELEEHSCESSLKSRFFWKVCLKMVFKIKDGGCRGYDQSEPVSKPQNTTQLFYILIC